MTDEHHVGDDVDAPSMAEIHAAEQREEDVRREWLFGETYETDDPVDTSVAPAEVDSSQCRFCREEFDDHADLTAHSCEGMREARSRAPVEDAPLLETGTHELGAHFLFAADNMANYWALVSGFDNALGNQSLRFEAAGETWKLNHDEKKVNYWQGKIAAREDDAPEAFNEYNIGVVVPDAVGRKRVNFQFRPALPNATHVETGETIQSLPDDLPEGIRVQVDSANVDPKDIIDILQGLARALDINPRYFSRECIHGWSRGYNVAQYVRIRRSVSEQRITSRGALLDRLAQFASDRRGAGAYEWDNEEIIGHRNTVVLNQTACKQFLRGRHGQQVGKLLKSYHMKNPESEASSSATSHPKLEVQFSTEHSDEFASLNSEHVPWRSEEHFDVRDLQEELEEWLLNCLHWAGLPLRADDVAYVDDAYWDLEETHRDVPLVDDPTDSLEDAHRDLATHHANRGDLTESERDVLRVLTDGGALHYQDLAAEADTSESTVYRLVEKLGDVISRDNGRYSLESDIIRERFQELLEPVESAIDWAKDQLPQLAREDSLISEDSAFAKWMRTYGVSASKQNGEYAFEIAAGYYDKHEIQEVLRSGYDAARQIGPNLADQFIDASVSWRTKQGGRRSLDRAAVLTDGAQIRFLGAALREHG